MIGLQNFDSIVVAATGNRSASGYGADADVTAYNGWGKCIVDTSAQGSGKTITYTLQTSPAATAGASMVTTGDADLPLNKSTSGKTTLAAKFTQSGARSIKSIMLRLKKTGTIASDKVLTVTIQGDSSGPDGSAIGTAGTVLANTIGSSAYEWVTFTFTTPVNVADSTVYWVTLASNYTASDSNYINWHVTTVTSGGTAAVEASASWTAVTTQDPLLQAFQYVFSDTTTVFSACANAAANQALDLCVDSLGAVVRAKYVCASSPTGYSSMILLASKQYA